MLGLYPFYRCQVPSAEAGFIARLWYSHTHVQTTVCLAPAAGLPDASADASGTEETPGPDQLPISSLHEPQSPPLSNGGIGLDQCFKNWVLSCKTLSPIETLVKRLV